jgi:hypothetical protein
LACLSVLPPIFCNTHIRLAGSIVSFWRALFLASRFPIRPATSLCLSAVSPCPSFPRLYKRPIPALLRLPPCPAFFCSPILAPSPLFCLFAKHFHTAAYPRSPAVVFSPLARPLLLSLSVTGFLPQTLSVLLLFPSSFAFSRALFLLFRFGARFPFLAVFQYGLQRLCVFPPFRLARLSLGFIKGRFPPCCACRRALPFSAPLFWSRLPCFVSPFCKTLSHNLLSPLACCRFLSSCPAAFALFIGHRVSAPNLVRLASVSFLFCLFPRSVSVVSFWRALFLFTRFLYRLSKRFSFWFASLFLVPLLITLFQKQTAALQHLPLRLFVSILSLFSLMPYFFWHVYLALPCPNKAQRVFVSLFLSAFLPGCLLLSTLALAKPFSPGIPPKYPVAPPFLRTKKPAHSPVFSL